MAGYYTPSPWRESWYTAAVRATERLEGILTMEIGCHLPTTQTPETMGDALVTFAREAERLNAASLWVSDHVVIPKVSTGYGRGGSFPHPPERPYLEAVTPLAAPAGCTPPARARSSGFPPRPPPPVVLAPMPSRHPPPSHPPPPSP